MKKILVSLMTICLVAGIIGGGLFADWTDIEISRDNYFKAGAMDLKISDAEGNWYQYPDVPPLIQYQDAMPESWKEFFFDLHNVGQGEQFIPWVYMHIVNLECFGIQKVQPEIAAETGNAPVGITADGQLVYAAEDWTRPAGPDNPALLGEFGENCEFAEHVEVEIYTSTVGFEGPWTQVDLTPYTTRAPFDIVKFDELVCQQISLGQLPNCEVIYVMVRLRLQDIYQNELGFDLPVIPKFEAWPTNALMKDGMRFDMVFELLQFPVVDVPPIVEPPVPDPCPPVAEPPEPCPPVAVPPC